MTMKTSCFFSKKKQRCDAVIGRKSLSQCATIADAAHRGVCSRHFVSLFSFLTSDDLVL